MNWTALTSVEQLKTLIDKSTSESSTFALFKHSTRCSISTTVKSRLERGWEEHPDLPIYLLDLLNYRDVSNAIEKVLEVQHESPQLLVVKNGQVTFSANHLAISAKEAQESV